MTDQTMTPADAVETLTGQHQSQHRCDDGIHYGPKAFHKCPMNRAAATLTDAITAERARVHAAAHDPDAVCAVAEGMTGLTMADLTADDRQGWELTARMAIEALAAHLDPDVTEDVEP